MKRGRIVDLLNALDQWQHRGLPIHEVLLILGDDHNELGRMLMLNGIADFNYEPMPDFSYQTLVNAVLLYLAMRHGLGTEAPKQKSTQRL